MNNLLKRIKLQYSQHSTEGRIMWDLPTSPHCFLRNEFSHRIAEGGHNYWIFWLGKGYLRPEDVLAFFDLIEEVLKKIIPEKQGEYLEALDRMRQDISDKMKSLGLISKTEVSCEV